MDWSDRDLWHKKAELIKEGLSVGRNLVACLFGDAAYLQHLARRFDAIPADDIESRLAVAVDIEKCLGDQRDEFDRRYCRLIEDAPTYGSPAVAVLRSMGLCTGSAVDLDQHRAYPTDANDRLDRAWDGLSGYVRHRDRGYIDWLAPGDLPALVCRGYTSEGRKFIAIQVRTYLADGIPENDEVPVVAVVHHRYIGNETWVWAGVSYGSLHGYADPDLVEALLAGRTVVLRGGAADGYRIEPVSHE